MRLQQLARDLFPYLQPLIEKVGRNGNGGGAVVLGGAPSPHAYASSHHTGTIPDAHAPQFLMRDGSRSLTGNLSVAAGVTIDGVDLSAHAADPDAHHARATAGNGIAVTGQQVAVDLAANSKLEFSGGDLRVDLDADFTWLGNHRFEQDVEIAANLSFVDGNRAIIAEDDLFIEVGGDLILDDADTFRSSDYADGIPIAGFSFHLNSASNRQLTINTIKADELHVRLFVADTTRIDVGEEYWGKSMGILYEDFTTPSSIGGTVTIKVEDSPAFSGALFSNNDWVLIRIIEDSGGGLVVASIWGQVSGYTDLGEDAEGRGRQSWTFTLRQGPTEQVVKAGNVIVDFGASGQGYVHLSTLDSADGPWIAIGEWNGANPYTPGNRSVLTQIGNLDNISDTDLNPAGYGLYSDNAYLKGIVRTTESIMDDEGFATQISSSAGFDAFTGARIAWWSDLNSRTGTAPIQIAGWESSSSSGSKILQIQTLTPSSSNLSRIDAFASAGGFGTVNSAQVRLTGHESLSAVDIFAEGDGSTPGDAEINIAAIGTSSLIKIAASEIRIFGDILPNLDGSYDLGSAGKQWDVIYAKQLIISGSISGDTLSGAEWQHSGSMVIDANSGSNTTVSITNQGAGVANLAVDNNITLGGTIDGVDLAAFKSAYDSHVANANAHHNAVTVGNTGLSLSGQQVSLNLNSSQTSLEISSGLRLATAAAGNGLTINSTTRVLSVGQGDGISVGSTTVGVDSSVVRTSRTLTAGSGLTGGGDLSANRTFNVGQGNGITVNADDVAVRLAASSPGLTFVSGGLSVDSSVVRTSRQVATTGALAGGGDLSANRTISLTLATNSGLNQSSGLAVGAGTGITVSGATTSINQGFSPTWTGTHQFNVDIQLNANLDFLGARTITSNSSNNLTIAPGGDLELNPGGSDVLPGGSAAIDLGDYNRKWRTLFASELYVETLVAQDVMATIGGRVMVAPTTTLIADMNNSQTTIDVKHNIFANGDFILLQTAPAGAAQMEVMKVTSSATIITGGYRYTVTRNQDGSGANSWVSGDAVVHLGGAVGEGYIDLTSTQTLHSHLGPTITIYSRTGTTNWNDTKAVVTMGNLDSFVGYGTEFGFAAGNDLTLTPSTGFSGFTADRTNGVRLFNTNLQLYSGSTLVTTLDQTNGLRFARGASGNSIGRISWFDAIGSTRVFDIQAILDSGANMLYFNMGGQPKILLNGTTSNVEFPGGKIDLQSGVRSEIKITNLTGAGREWGIGTSVTSNPSGASDGDLWIYDYTANTLRAKMDSTTLTLYTGLAINGGNLDLPTGGIAHSVHPNGYRWRQYATNGYYVNSSRVNIIAFNMGGFSGATVRLSYAQFNTGSGSDEPRIALAVIALTFESSSFPVLSASYLGNNHATVAFQTSGSRVLIYLTRSTGTAFRSDNDRRYVTVEVMGNVSNIEVAPSAI